jgi:hypothetical protein
MQDKITKNIPLIFAAGLVLAGLKKNNKEEKKCNVCDSARFFKSQLGEDVAKDTVWQAVNQAFNDNVTAIKQAAFDINQATTVTAYNTAKAQLDTLSTNTQCRILVCQPDGTVYYDSSKNSTNKNTLADANAKTINENHNTRPAIMSAQLTCDGVGNEIKLSTSTNQIEAYDARRIVDKYGDTFGTVRLSKQQAV